MTTTRNGRACLLRGAVFVLMLGPIGAGCTRAPSQAAGPAIDSPREKAVKFAECMRDNGVATFPDPDASGGLTIDGVVNGSSIDTDGPTWKEALDACQDLEPSGFTGRARTPQEQDHALVFARCIREHGVRDFPDPVPGEPLIDTYKIPSSDTDAGMRILNAAVQACRRPAAAAGARP